MTPRHLIYVKVKQKLALAYG